MKPDRCSLVVIKARVGVFVPCNYLFTIGESSSANRPTSMSNLVLIFTAAWLLLASVYAQEFIDPNCNPEVSRHERVERIRFAILGRLNLDVAPQNPLFPSNISSSKMADFNAVQELNRISKATRIPCTEPMAFSTTKRVSFPKKVPHYHYSK